MTDKLKPIDWIDRIKGLRDDSSLEHWREADADDGKEFFGEFCTPEEIPSLKAFALATREMEEKLARYEKLERFTNSFYTKLGMFERRPPIIGGWGWYGDANTYPTALECFESTFAERNGQLSEGK